MKALIKKPGFFYHLKQDKYKEKIEEKKEGPSYLGQIYQNVKIKFSRSFTRSSCSSHVRWNKNISLYDISQKGILVNLVSIFHFAILKRITEEGSYYYRKRPNNWR